MATLKENTTRDFSMEGALFHHAPAINQHAEATLLTPSAKLDHAVSNSCANGLPDITISSLQGQYLSIQAQLIGAKRILEIGTLGGYSTIWFASSGAKVTSIEIDPKRREVALQNTQDLDVEIILGDALEVLPRLYGEVDGSGKGLFDMVFVDASWENQWAFFDWAVKLTRKGGCIYVDNVVRELIDSGEEGNGIGVGETLLKQMGKDDRVQATLVGVANSHKPAPEMYDGFVLAIVK